MFFFYLSLPTTPNNFVLQEDGKGLSTEDFTTEEKKLLASLAKETTSGFDAQDLLDIFDD